MASYSNSTRITMAATSLVATIYSISTLVQLGGLEVSVVWASFTPSMGEAAMVGLASYGLLFLLPEARKWVRFASWEQPVIIITPILLMAHGVSPYLQDLISTSPPIGMGLFALALFAGGVMLR